ncbi:hypothetical protein T552_03513 [Pneumocystis carinii B80]|uniref:CWF21 domain-containing protein n=1 Tax=Pneumocystis carinii (strain B80) TaxID=1408658 RepID=A0A0W4ZBL0_PNEC8|nr:hypothetical protein T552_03513 [Pneumocystis carinii B80]KTW25653.1 hypothetical protein T552_03513 [Pneumocystis carinii B80]
MSYNGIGLPTPRGSGTNGYIVRNLSHIRHPREAINPYPSKKSTVRKADKEILEHDRKRKLEIKVLSYRDSLEENRELDEEEIEKKVNEYREKLLNEKTEEIISHDDVKNLKSYQVHELATAKARELEKLRKAFGIREDYQEGDAFKCMNEKRAN